MPIQNLPVTLQTCTNLIIPTKKYKSTFMLFMLDCVFEYLSEGTNETHDEGTIQKKRKERSNVQAIFREIMVYFILCNWNKNDC